MRSVTLGALGWLAGLLAGVVFSLPGRLVIWGGILVVLLRAGGWL